MKGTQTGTDWDWVSIQSAWFGVEAADAAAAAAADAAAAAASSGQEPCAAAEASVRAVAF